MQFGKFFNHSSSVKLLTIQFSQLVFATPEISKNFERTSFRVPSHLNGEDSLHDPCPNNHYMNSKFDLGYQISLTVTYYVDIEKKVL